MYVIKNKIKTGKGYIVVRGFTPAPTLDLDPTPQP